MHHRIVAPLLSCLLGLGLFAGDKVTFAVGEWEPYTGQKLEAFGMAAEVVSAACSAAGLEADFEFVPWKRAEATVEDGSRFATFPYQATAERQARFDFSEVLCRSSIGILFHPGNARIARFSYSRPEDIKGFKVGGLLGSDAINQQVRKAGAQVEEVQSVEQNLVKLAMERVDFVIDDRPVLFHAVQRIYGFEPGKGSQFAFADRDFGPATEYRLMVSRRFPGAKDLLARFNAGLEKIIANGKYQTITRKYGL